MILRKNLHKAGYRFRIHVAALPGKPDLVLKKYRAVIFVNGCFWHGHDCHLFKLPSTRRDFWKSKIDGNRLRDYHNTQRLVKDGWRVLTVWECAFKGRFRQDLPAVLAAIENWLKEEELVSFEIRGINA